MLQLEVKYLYIWKNIFHLFIILKSSSALPLKMLSESCPNLLRQTLLICLLPYSPYVLTLFLFVARVK